MKDEGTQTNESKYFNINQLHDGMYKAIATVKHAYPSNFLIKEATTAGTCLDQNQSYALGCLTDNFSLIKLSSRAESRSKLNQYII
jgi:hypothetical protein